MWALRDVTFTVNKGEAFGVVGANGSGKSTLLQIIAGILRPTAGSVEVRGRLSALLELGSGFAPEFSGRQNVYLNVSILGLSTDEIGARFETIARFAGIGDFIDQPIRTYSTGMVLRLAFAVAAHVDPEILIVDEALAVEVDEALMARILEARKVFAADLPAAMRPQIEFFDPTRYNAAATVQDNVLFGKIAYGEAAAPT